MLMKDLENLKKGTELVLNKNGLYSMGNGTLNKNTIFKLSNIEGYLYSLKAYNNGVYVGRGVFSYYELSKMFEVAPKKINIEVIENSSLLPPDVKKVVINDEVTIVILKSGCKAVSKPMAGDTYDRQVGFRVAYIKAKMKELKKELKKY